MIRTLLLLVRKDLLRKLRSPLGISIVLAFPLLFAGMLALAFGSSGDSVPKVRLLLENRDDGLLADAVASAFTSSRMAEFFDVTSVGPEGASLMDEGKASALLTIPAGFSRDLLDGRPVTLTLVRNPAEGILPEIAAQVVGTLADLLDGSRRVLDAPLVQLGPYLRGEGGEIGDAAVVAISLAVKKAVDEAAPYLSPPAMTLESELLGNSTPGSAGTDAKGTKGSVSSIFLIVLPGVAVYALFLVGDLAMRDVMTERTAGTLRRQLAGPVSPGTIILGKALYTYVLASICLLLLAATAFLVHAGPVDFPAFVVLSAGLVLAITGTSAAIYGLARTERQAATLSSIVYLAMAFAGGAFIPLESLPATLKAVAPFTPFYWGTQGFRALLESGAGVFGILRHAGVLAATGVVLLAVGTIALHRTARRGAGA